jgi:hypothetical protein
MVRQYKKCWHLPGGAEENCDNYQFVWLVFECVIEWLTLLLRIQEALHSNHSPETGYPDRFF